MCVVLCRQFLYAQLVGVLCVCCTMPTVPVCPISRVLCVCCTMPTVPVCPISGGFVCVLYYADSSCMPN